MKANLDKNLAPAWVSGKSYSTGEFCLYNKRLYICTTDNSDAEFDISKWETRNLVDLVSGINSNLGAVLKGLVPTSVSGLTWTVSISSYKDYKKITIDNIVVQTNWAGGNSGWGARSFSYDQNTGIITCTSSVNDYMTISSTVNVAIVR